MNTVCRIVVVVAVVVFCVPLASCGFSTFAKNPSETQNQTKYLQKYVLFAHKNHMSVTALCNFEIFLLQWDTQLSACGVSACNMSFNMLCSVPGPLHVACMGEVAGWVTILIEVGVYTGSTRLCLKVFTSQAV